jgi:hypothetical protein
MSRLIALFLCAVFAAGPGLALHVMRGPAAASLYLVTSDFEETGIPAAWTTGSSPDWDYTSAPLAGAQSLRMANSSTSATVAFSPANEVWSSFLYNTADVTQSPFICEPRSSGGSRIARVRLLTTGAIRIYRADGTSTGATSGAGVIANNTTYDIVISYNNTTNTLTVYTRSGGVSTQRVSDTANDSASDWGSTSFSPGATVACVWDNLLVSQSDLR